MKEMEAVPLDLSVPASRRPSWVAQGIRLEWFTLIWNVIEALIAVGAGLMAGSIALKAFLYVRVSSQRQEEGYSLDGQCSPQGPDSKAPASRCSRDSISFCRAAIFRRVSPSRRATLRLA